MAFRFAWEGTDEDWGVGAESLLMPSNFEGGDLASSIDSDEWDEARCVPYLDGEQAFVTIAAARVLLGELFGGGHLSIYSTYYAGEYGLLLAKPGYDLAADLDGRGEPEAPEFIYIAAESPFQWEFLLSLGAPVLPSPDEPIHVEVGADGEATWRLVIDRPAQEFRAWRLENFTEVETIWTRATWSGLSPSQQVNVIRNVQEDGRDPAMLVAALIPLHPGTSLEAHEALGDSDLHATLAEFTDLEGVVAFWRSDAEEN